ncbi:MAG: hypothetical protein AAF389_12845 [Gemmatimonadota bacterium]
MKGDRRRALGAALLMVGIGIAPGAAGAQDIADFDYEHLSFRGIGLEFGYLWPNNVEPTESYTLRIDLGYAGPGLRITPSVTYWRSQLGGEEITEFETRVLDLIAEQNGGTRPTLDLGIINYTDIAIGVDAHVVWELPFDVLTFGGFGVTAHVIDGDGDVIASTFVEDLFDSVDPGFNLHVGTEYPVTNRMRLYASGRYEVLPDMQYAQVRGGLQFMIGPNAPGEGRNDR